MKFHFEYERDAQNIWLVEAVLTSVEFWNLSFDKISAVKSVQTKIFRNFYISYGAILAFLIIKFIFCVKFDMNLITSH